MLNTEKVQFTDSTVTLAAQTNNIILKNNYGETIVGTTGNDTIDGAGGSDFIDGAAGTDTAVFFGNRSDFTITNLSGVIQVTGLSTAPYEYRGVTTKLTNIEKVQFSSDVSTSVPEITVSGNAINILDGDSTPSTTDGTSFGSIAQGATAVVRTFTVKNDGGATLTLGAPILPSGFSIVSTNPLVTSLAPGASDTFQVRLDSTVAGTKSGQISIATNDSNENPFNFSISGTVTASTLPEITVSGNAINILDGDSTPSTTDGTSFGSIAQGATAVVRTFTVKNDGGATLTLGAPILPSGFSIVSTNPLVTSLAPGASDTFQVRLDSTVAGTKSGQISIATNDSNENPFNFSVIGAVTATQTPWSKPIALVNFPVIGGANLVTQGYGGTSSHILNSSIEYAIDFPVVEGTSVTAVSAGTVVSIRNTSSGNGDIEAGRLGKFVTILHDQGFYATYAHLSSTANLTPGVSRVALGDEIGKSGNTGISTGPHLHFHSGLTTKSNTQTDITNGWYWADGTTSKVPPVFFVDFFANTAETANLVDVLKPLSIQATDIFGTANTYSNPDPERLIGTLLDNRIFGGAGADFLSGKEGNDILVGGSNADTFVFDTALGADNIDTIADYSVIDDTIQLENSVYTALTATGTLAVGQFRIGAQALDTDDFVIYNNTTGALLYDGDGNGAGAAVQIATLGVGLAMTNAEIVVI